MADGFDICEAQVVMELQSAPRRTAHRCSCLS